MRHGGPSMGIDASIDVHAMYKDGVLLDVVTKGNRTRLRLGMRACQQLAVLLALSGGTATVAFERGIRLNLPRSRHVVGETVDPPQPRAGRTTPAARSPQRGAIVRKG